MSREGHRLRQWAERPRRVAPRTAVDGAFALLVGATIVCYLVMSNRYGFRDDDWWLVQRGRSLGDYFQPYNDHLSIVPIAIYRLLLTGFGLRSYLPLRLVGIGSSVGIAVAIYLLVRSRAGAPVALVVGAAVLWYPSLLLVPSGFNHHLALAAVILCAWLATRDKPADDLFLGLGLAFALCTSGVAVIGAVGLLVSFALAGAPARRWAAVAVPTTLWTAWWLFVAKRSRTGAEPQTLGHRIRFVGDGVAISFRNLVGGSSVLAMLLAAVLIAHLAWRLRRGPRAASHELAWAAALVSWWVLLSYSRLHAGPFDRASSNVLDAFRYQIVGSALVVLSLLPVVRSWPGLRRMDSYRAAGAGLLVAGMLVHANQAEVFRNARAQERSHQAIREGMIVANLGPQVVPDDGGMYVGFVTRLPVREYRRLVARFGAPPGTRPAHPDAALVEIGHIRPIVAPDPGRGRCAPLRTPTEVPPTSKTFLRSLRRTVRVQVRRFGRTWVTIGRIRPGTTVAIDLPGLQATRPWSIRAIGACLDPDPATSINLPRLGSTVSEETAVQASTFGTERVGKIMFRISGGKYSNTLLGKAVKTRYGWVYGWDTETVPDGRYTLTSVASDATGDTVTSAGVRVTVRN